MRRHRCSSTPTRSFSSTQFRGAPESRRGPKETRPRSWTRPSPRTSCRPERVSPRVARTRGWRRRGSSAPFGEMGALGPGRQRLWRRKRRRRMRRRTRRRRRGGRWRWVWVALGSEKTRGSAERPWWYFGNFMKIRGWDGVYIVMEGGTWCARDVGWCFWALSLGKVVAGLGFKR